MGPEVSNTRRWYTADPHFGHKRIIELCDRPFGSVEEMNDGIVENFNSVVGPDDELWILGDVCMGNLDESLEVVSRLNGKKILKPGNHDRMSPAYHHKGNREEKVAMFTEKYLQVFDEIKWADPWRELIDGRFVLMSHFPYTGDSHGEDRYADLRPKDTGLPLVHGHVHTEWKERGRMLNVGVDVWDFHPVPESTIARWARRCVLPTDGEDNDRHNRA